MQELSCLRYIRSSCQFFFYSSLCVILNETWDSNKRNKETKRMWAMILPFYFYSLIFFNHKVVTMYSLRVQCTVHEEEGKNKYIVLSSLHNFSFYVRNIIFPVSLLCMILIFLPFLYLWSKHTHTTFFFGYFICCVDGIHFNG